MKTYRDWEKSEKRWRRRLLRSELSKNGKCDNDSPIYRLQKRKVAADRLGTPIEWAARSAGKVLADRLACSIRMPPVRSATHFEYFVTIFDVSISMDDATNTIEFLVKLLSVPITISTYKHLHFTFRLSSIAFRVSIRFSIDLLEYHTTHKVSTRK